MAAFQLDLIETRILGCLMEKERTTPENYPLSLNSLTAACNQSTNREPVLSLDEHSVEEGLFSLRQKKLATAITQAGSRVQKYRHNLPDHYELDLCEWALLCVLLLRGAQTPGELRSRTERLCGLLSLEEIDRRIDALGQGQSPLVRVLAARPGQKERRIVQLLSDESLLIEPAQEAAPPRRAEREEPLVPGALGLLKEEMTSLRAELAQLREEFAAFRKQFE